MRKISEMITRLIFEKIVDTAVKLVGMALVVVILLQIAFRYLIPMSAAWTDEISRYLFMWFCFLGSAYAMYKEAHFSIDFIAQRMSLKGKYYLAFFSRILTVLFSIFLIYYGVQLMETVRLMKSTYLRWPMDVFYVIMPVSGILYLIDSLDWFLREERRNKRPESE